MCSWRETNKWKNLLNNSLIHAGAEVFFIKKVKNISKILHFNHLNYLCTELYLEVEGFSYFSIGDTYAKTTISYIILTYVPQQQITKVDSENITLLLLDECDLIRYAAQDLYKQKQAS